MDTDKRAGRAHASKSKKALRKLGVPDAELQTVGTRLRCMPRSKIVKGRTREEQHARRQALAKAQRSDHCGKTQGENNATAGKHARARRIMLRHALVQRAKKCPASLW